MTGWMETSGQRTDDEGTDGRTEIDACDDGTDGQRTDDYDGADTTGRTDNIYMYIYIYIYFSLSLSLYIYTYIYIYI